MIKSLITSIKLRFTYKTNSFIYSFRTIPFIGNLIPTSLYNTPNLKLAIAIIITVLAALIAYPLLYLFYILGLWFFYDLLFSEASALYFAYVFLIGAIVVSIFKPLSVRSERDSDYAINSMHMPAKTYLLSNYLYKSTLLFFGFTGAILLLHLLTKSDELTNIPAYYALILPILHLSIKNIKTYINIKYIDKMPKYNMFMVLLILSIIPLIYVQLYQPELLSILMKCYTGVFICLGIASLIGLFTYNRYHFIFKKLFNARLAKKSLKEVEIDQISNTIDSNTKITSNKHGYDLLHDLFVKRHSKILAKTVLSFTVIEIIIVIGMVIVSLLVPELRDAISVLYSKYSLYFLIVMYCINRGEKISKAMFMNCDHAMLTYRTYRSSKVILEMFKRRLKTLISLNLLPASVLAIGSLILLIITKANLFSIIFFPLSLIFLSVFFSVHNLVLYYLLQPYNSETETRSKSYRIANSITYLLCFGPGYYFDIIISPELFSIICLSISIIYIIAALYIVHKYAPKTFRINYE